MDSTDSCSLNNSKSDSQVELRPIGHQLSIHRQRASCRQRLQPEGLAGDVAHIRRADGVVVSSFHGKKQSQKSRSGDPRPHKGQVDQPIVEPGLGRSVKISPQVGLIQGQYQDKVPFDGDPISGGNGLVEGRQQVVPRHIQK
ncbi:hypothetical protein EYF80_008680 [Liparis tanakae]|uniref:Uncharacterized protein n=1 Tax=Liparis tanakae TaxID=230148 RepID=A0A4Z2IU15_9TELE|nr:hypothetical protein EYF80_008680 [Liparis tanakae]